MKRIIAFLLSIALLLSGCAQTQPSSQPTETDTVSTENSNVPILELTPKIPEYGSLDNPKLLGHIEDLVYSETVTALNSTEYFVENVSAIYLSNEYLDALAFNSQENIYFGHTLTELNALFQGTRYIFTLGADGQTTVHELQEIKDTTSQEIIKDVAIGAGIIFVCVTVSVVTGTGAPAVSLIFAASAKTATTMALSSAAFGGISAGVVKGIETGDMNQALKAAAVASSEGFKWGAISGAIIGGGKEVFALKSATHNGLTMNQVATIQKESGYPLDVIKQFHTVKEYEAFKIANLKPAIVGNKTALIKTNIDLKRIDSKGRTNLERMKQGLAPQDSNGISYELHHVGQKKNGTLAIMSQAEHDNPEIHGFLKKTEAHAAGTNWDAERKAFWKAFAELIA